MSQRAAPSSITQPMFPVGERKVVRCRTAFAFVVMAFKAAALFTVEARTVPTVPLVAVTLFDGTVDVGVSPGTDPEYVGVVLPPE